MYSYVVCSLFFLVLVVLLTFIGWQLSESAEFSYNLILGYIVYSFPIAVVGIIIQLLNLPWIIFALFLGIEWIILVFVSGVFIKKRNIKIIQKQEFSNFVKNNWVVFLTTVLMVAVMLLYYRGFWLGNHQDDGFYITRVATLPFIQTGGNFNYALGVENVGLNTYLFNTWELEASVYVRVLGVSVTLFLRLFQSAFHYFLLANLLKAFSKKIMVNVGFPIKENLYQYPVFVILLFNVYYLVLDHTHLLKLQDMFHMNTGMFLGFSIIRTLGVLMLLLFFFDKDKIDVKMVTGVAIISSVLISKSTVALPLIIITAVASLIVWLLVSYKNIGRIAIFILCVVIAIVGFIIPGSDSIQSTVYTNYLNALSSPVMWACMIVFLFSFTLRIPIINKLNSIVCCMVMLMMIPEVNDIFENISIYKFVSARTVSAWAVFFIMINSVYFCILLSRIHIKELWIKCIYTIACIGILGVSLVGFKLYGGEVIPGRAAVGAGIRDSLRTIKNNIYFMPDSTIDLGEKLDQLSDQTDETIKVVTPSMVIVDGALHPLPVMLRIYAPDIIPVSAAVRFPTNNGSELSEYTQQYYDSFASEPSDETYALFRKEIENLDVNCIIVYDGRCTPWLEKDNFELYDTAGDGMYRIWYKK